MLYKAYDVQCYLGQMEAHSVIRVEWTARIYNNTNIKLRS